MNEAHTADSLSRHRSVWEMRADGWIGLVDDLGRIATLARDHEDFEPCLKRVRTIVAALAPIESYWAFPGGRVLRTPALVAGMAYHRLRDLL